MEKEKRLTVGELRKALEGVPDELEVHFSSDTEEAYEIILTMARRVKYELPNGQRFEDTGRQVLTISTFTAMPLMKTRTKTGKEVAA